MLALGRLLRLSLAPSAAADVAAGIVLGRGAWPAGPAPFLLMAGSLCVYHGGMALNDWADREADARGARARPIPRGEVGANTALGLAVFLLVLGPLMALRADGRAGAALLAVALQAALYDLAGRGPWRRPILLGACRAGNLGAGIALGAVGYETVGLEDGVLSGGARWLVLAPLLYGGYVLCVSRIARLEDGSPRALAAGKPDLWLGLAALALALHGLVPLVPGGTAARLCAGAIACAGAIGLLGARPAGGAWSPAVAGRATGMGLRRLLVCTAALSVQVGTTAGFVAAAGILCGYPVSHALRRVFPPT